MLPPDRPNPDAFDSWAGLATGHELWSRVRDAGEPPRERVAGLVADLATVRRAAAADLAADRWQDPELAARMSARLSALLSEADLTAAEAELLAVTPFLYDTLWASMVAAERGVGPQDLTPSPDATSERAAFERFAQSYAQPYRRATAAARTGRREAAEDIGWWLLHRWVGRRPAAYQPSAIAALLPSPAPHPDTARLARLLRAMRADPGFLSRDDRADALAAAESDGVRERFIGYVLAVARGLAVESTLLPEVVGAHLGIADPVSPRDVLATVRTISWQPRGPALVLAATCPHPAIEVALRSHVDTLNQLLAEAHRSATADPALQHLPAQVTTDQLHPSIVDGERAYRSAGIRFRLAEDRVQELLMGEQLYGDPGLAIRELYQNALDACRYRAARTEYLHRTAGLDAAWTGQIRFSQGVDAGGKAYVDCVDNGIGMGVRELSEVFAQAGVRLADLPEFLEEQAEWARLDPPVQLFPNSRFGIGVLSYFMLADEITVETCRMGRDGRPSNRLGVAIAGPGSLFRVRDLGPGTEAGTTVRLHLRDGGAQVSTVEKLRAVLLVADFHTEATDGARHQVWLPGELSDSGDVVESTGPEGSAVVAAAGARVWWCRGDGALLSDGLYAGRDIFGAVVNLSRDLAPRLSVDRTKILAYREEDVDRLLWEAVPDLISGGANLLSFDWLYSLARVRPLIADLVFEQALAAGHRQWLFDGNKIDAAVAGCFGPDEGTIHGPDELIEWRLTALAAAGRYPKVLGAATDWRGVVRALPSDALLLSIDVDGAAPWLDPVDIVPLVHLVRAARRIGRSASDMARRLDLLGFNPSVGHETVGSDPDDLLITSRDVDGSRPWLDPANPVSLIHLLRAGHRTGRPVRELVNRLRRIGYDVDVNLDLLPMEQFGPQDLLLASADLDGAHPWLDPNEAVPLLHLIRAAHKTGRDTAEIATRLAALGHRLADGWHGMHAEPDDLVLISRDLDGTGPWLDPAEPVSPIHLLRAAERTARPVAEVARRLRSFGYPVGVDPAAIELAKLEPEDLVLASRDVDGSAPWLDPAQPVPLIHLLRAAEATGRDVRDVLTRLAACGYRIDIDPDGILIDHLEPDDATLTSHDLDGSDPWLDPSKPVPAIRLFRAAQRTRRSIHDVAARLTVLGYAVSLDAASKSANALRHDADDLVITSRDLDGSQPWLELDERVLLPHLLQAARRVRRPLHEIAARLRELGYVVDADLDAVSIDAVKSSDLVLASADLDGSRPWLDPADPVSLRHLVAASQKVRKPLGEVAARLAALGYGVPDIDARLPRLRPGGG